MQARPKSAEIKAAICLHDCPQPGQATHTTEVRITPLVKVSTDEGWLRFWVAGREVRVGPLSREQAATLAEDLEWQAAEGE